jgi:hypothetical protein
MKCYRIRLREWGLTIKCWGKVYAPSAIKAINQVCIDGKPYQEWIASEVKNVS